MWGPSDSFAGEVEPTLPALDYRTAGLISFYKQEKCVGLGWR